VPAKQWKNMTSTNILSADRLRRIILDRHPDNFMAFSDLFAMGCLLHLQGQHRAGRKLIDQVRGAVTVPGNKTYLADLVGQLAGNELRFAGEIHAHQEINELLDAERDRGYMTDSGIAHQVR
jgi:hypothetical protein